MRDIVHDCIVSVKDKIPSNNEVETIINNLPSDIMSLAMTWGQYDTEVREKICEFIQRGEYENNT